MKQLFLILALLFEKDFNRIEFETIKAWANPGDNEFFTIEIFHARGELKITSNPFHFLCSPNAITMIMDILKINCIDIRRISATQKIEIVSPTGVVSIYMKNDRVSLAIQHFGSAVFTFETY